jgi:hypothetical protein
VDSEKRSEIVEWIGTVWRCLLRSIPLVACWRVDVNDSMKSGIATERGSRMPRPPALMLSCAMSRAWCGRDAVPAMSDRNFFMIWFVVEVSGPSQSVQSGGGLLGSKWCRTLLPRIWGSFWMRHCEKSQSLVFGLVIASEMRVILV